MRRLSFNRLAERELAEAAGYSPRYWIGRS